MNNLYEHNDNNFRSYHGILLEDAEMSDLLKGSVFDNMIDVEVRDRLLTELAGLLDTGFSSENLLADIQALENAVPEDLRTWRIGEALTEIVLEQNFQCRFHWNELRDARNPKGNKAGADLVGFIEIEGNVLFLFGEVKTSSETAHIPPLVMTKSDGIENKLKELYSKRDKRNILISYLASKTINLADDHQFKIDLRKAIHTYYNSEQYQLIGVLIRDVTSDDRDVSLSYEKIKTTILEPVGLKLIALYTSIKKEEWPNIIKSVS